MSTTAIIVIAGLVVLGIIGWHLLGGQNGSTAASSAPSGDGHAVPPPSSDRDRWEGSFWDAGSARSLTKRLQLVYVDGDGNRTQREVTLKSFEPDNPRGLMIGHCSLRNATRTFRYDRISRCTDMETGEVIGNVREFLNAAYDATPVAATDRVLGKNWDLFRILYYVAKADGAMRAAEVEVIAGLFRKIAGDDSITVDAVKAAMGAVDLANVRGFTAACRKLLADDPAQFERAVEAAKGIVATQKTVHPNEVAALEIMDSILKAKA